MTTSWVKKKENLTNFLMLNITVHPPAPFINSMIQFTELQCSFVSKMRMKLKCVLTVNCSCNMMEKDA